MYKVIIIDDENIILHGLKTIINWSDYGCEVCETAKNAKEGLEKIIANKPDIILTDIKMKNSNGLDMIEQALEHVPDAKIIVMTGYRTFEYAYHAISLGVFAFLLKPTNPDDIKTTIQKAVQELDEQILKKNDIEHLQSENTQYKSIYIENTLSDFINFKSSPNVDIDSFMRTHSANFNSYCILSIYIDGISNQLDIEKKEKIKSIILNRFNNSFTPYLINPDFQKNIITIVLTYTEDLSKYNITIPTEQINLQLSELFCTMTSIGVSPSSTDFNELEKKYHESIRALEHRKYTGDGTVIFFTDISVPKFIENYTNHMQQTLFDYVLSGNIDAMGETLSAMRQSIYKNDINYVQSFCYDTIIKLYSAAEKLLSYLHFDEETASLEKFIYKCDDPDELVSLLYDIAYDMTDKIHELNNALVMYTINKIKSYVGTHFAEPITRQSIAEHIGITPNYISTIFKKSTGISLVSYITQVRIDKAKELLSSGKYKHTEIASMVGFNDGFYFSKSFKKITGMTPSDYQKKHLDINNTQT